ncbi:hypothetical protein ACGFSB_33565 [Streptomyces sp. NPDC048441]|uniref:hypothetical protein n=1 Tax=Streptomyces sp. NPDC048441 TaxID=3365552 RepID=UPI0037148AA4
MTHSEPISADQVHVERELELPALPRPYRALIAAIDAEAHGDGPQPPCWAGERP